MPGPLRPDRPIPPIHRGKPDVSSSVPGRKTKVAPSARTYPLSEAVVVSSDSEDEAAHEIEELQSHHKRSSETAVNTALTKRQRLPTSGPGQAAQDSSESEAEHPSQQSAEENSGSVTRVSESASSAAEDRSRAVSEAVSETESGGDSVEDRDATRERSNSDASEAQSGVDVTPTRRVPPYKPPTGFHPLLVRPTSLNSHSTRSLFGDHATLSSKQVWHITAPSTLPLDAIPLPPTILLSDVEAGNPILTHQGCSYSFVEGAAGELDHTVVLVPAEEGYAAARQPVAATFHIRAAPSRLRMGLTEGERHGTNDGRSQERGRRKREQPEGLRMRFLPTGFGEGDPGRIGRSSSEDEESSVSLPKEPPSQTTKSSVDDAARSNEGTTRSTKSPSKRKHSVLQDSVGDPQTAPDGARINKKRRREKQIANGTGEVGIDETQIAPTASVPPTARSVDRRKAKNPSQRQSESSMVESDAQRKERKEQRKLEKRRREHKVRRREDDGKRDEVP